MGRHSFATVIVGPSAMLREGLTRILSAGNFRITAAASSVEDIALTALPQDQPVLLVVDVCSDPGAAVREIELFKERYPTARIALVADHDQLSDSNIVEVLQAGAHAYLSKPTCATFVKSLELVMLGETILLPQLMSFVLHPHNEGGTSDFVRNADVLKEAESKYAPRLSAGELCTLRCLIEGNSNKTIARKTDIAEATVKARVKAILRKIGVNNRTKAAIWGMNNNVFIGR